MTNKIMKIAGLALFTVSAATLVKAETRLQQLERAVREDQAMIQNAGSEGKLLAVIARRDAAQKRLATDQAALDAYKTAGPTAYEQGLLEKAVEADQAEILAARREDKILSRLAREDAAKKKLARDQAALDQFKTAGPTAFERARLEAAIKSDEAEINHARFESKLLSREARTNSAKAKLSQHQTELAALQ